MENWLTEMEYFPIKEEMDDLLLQIRSISTARTKKVWKHIVTHVRPLKEVEMIKKQCLLHRLQNSSALHVNIEDKLNSMKDFDSYLKKKRNQSQLNNIRQEVEMKKIAIREQLQKLKDRRKNSLIEEETLKESVYKLNQLKKKKKSVERVVQKMENDTKILKVLKTSPNSFVNFGRKPSVQERKVFIYVSELPAGLELETVFSRMEELVIKSSQLPALPYWDRTETLTEMEKLLSSKLDLLNNRKSMSVEINKDLQNLLDSLVEILQQENNFDIVEFKLLLDGFQEHILKEALEIGRGLSESKTPYVLESERLAIRRFMYLIDGKVRNLNELLPVDIGDCLSSDLPDASSCDQPLPARPPIEKLVDSVLRDVKCFMELNLRKNLPEHIVDYVRPCTSGYHQLLQLNNEVTIRTKLMNIAEKIRNLKLSAVDVKSDYNDLPDKIDELKSSMSDNMVLIKNETETLDKIYRRVKAGFHFLRKEPLNESLTGFEINGKDVSYWLNRYTFAKKELDHQLWLLDNL